MAGMNHMSTLMYAPGRKVLLREVEPGDLVKLPDGKLASRDCEHLDGGKVDVVYCNGLSDYGLYTYTREIMDHDTVCEFVLSHAQLYGVLLRSQDVRDLIDAHLDIDKRMHPTFHE